MIYKIRYREWGLVSIERHSPPTEVFMTEFQQEILSLLRVSLNGEEPAGVNPKNATRIYQFAETQQLVAALYCALLAVPGFEEQLESRRFLERYCGYLGHDATQTESMEQIFAAFDAEGIAYMPLKGTVLKDMYPSPEMRTMGDADILIHPEDYKRIEVIMRGLGSHFDEESDHEYNWTTADGSRIELHKCLIPSYNKDYYAYYGDGWGFARLCEGSQTRYEMSPEDTFVYLFTHFAKHYRDQGVGLKYVLDFYVFMRRYPDLNKRYVKAELEKLWLSEFYENIMYMIDVWFFSAPATALSDYITDKIFSYGVFGNAELNVISQGLKLSKTSKSAQTKKKLEMFFPPYAVMARMYPILRKLAILLPFLWIVRLVDRTIHHRDRYRRGMANVARMSDENISQYQKELNYVGLDYHFGRDEPPPKGE